MPAQSCFNKLYSTHEAGIGGWSAPRLAVTFFVSALFFALMASPAKAEAFQIECGAEGATETQICDLPDDVTAVSLAENHTIAPCIFGQSWGLDGSKLWTSNGCAASFDVETGEPMTLEEAGSIEGVEDPSEDRKGYGYEDGVFRREA